jgi:hypothetical protein
VLVLSNEAEGARPPRPDETQAKDRRGDKSRRAAKAKDKAADDSQ